MVLFWIFRALCRHKVVTLFLILYFVCLVYDGKGTLEEGETAEARFIKIQAAYELLMDSEKKVQYDMDNRVNPMKVCIYKSHKLEVFFVSSEMFEG